MKTAVSGIPSSNIQTIEIFCPFRSYAFIKEQIGQCKVKKRLELYMAVLLLVAVCLLSRRGAVLVNSLNAQKEKPCIVLDAGHGGDDPGKVGVHGELEKDINLSIVKLLEKKLTDAGVAVVLTRNSDQGLDDPGSSNHKVSDMRNRCELIDKTKPEFTVSIHQNSYPEEPISGAQCFYFGQSAAGKELAEVLQEKLRQRLNPDNHRQAKANESYYLLKKTSSPTVIVECGFLSNSAESELLSTEEYQDKVAQAICEGILEYLGIEVQDATEAVITTEATEL